MLQTKNLTYLYPNSKPLAFPNINIESGEALLISGESGCGKTTLLHLLAGLRQATTGKVEIDGNNISNLSPSQLDQFRGKHIGIVYQQSYFIQSLSVLDNLLISPYVKDNNKTNTVAERLQINELLKRYPHQLSVGQQQRANIARAVINEPKLLLADEPTSSLDNKNCKKVLDLLLEEAAKNNTTLIVVTHDERLKSEFSNCIELESIIN